MQGKNRGVRELLGEARAIHFSMQNGVITYREAKIRTEPLLRRINLVIEEIAKKYKVKPKCITFQDLGTNL